MRTCVAIFCEVDGDLPTDTPRRANDERDLFVGLGHGGEGIQLIAKVLSRR